MRGDVFHEKHRVSPIGAFERVNQVNEIVHGDSRRGACRHAHRAAACGENARGLTGSGTHAEGFLLGDAEGSGKLPRDVALQIKHAVLKQLHGNLDKVGELERVNGFLRECGVAFDIGGVFRRPLRGGMGGRNGDFALRRGVDGLGDGADDVRLLQTTICVSNSVGTR